MYQSPSGILYHFIPIKENGYEKNTFYNSRIDDVPLRGRTSGVLRRRVGI